MADRWKLGGQDIAGFSRNAKDIDIDLTGTGLSSTNTEDAIKEIDGKFAQKTVHTKSITIAGDSVGYFKGEDFTPPVIQVGSKIGIVSGVDSGNANFIPIYFWAKTGTGLALGIRNISSSSVTDTGKLEIVWIGT